MFFIPVSTQNGCSKNSSHTLAQRCFVLKSKVIGWNIDFLFVIIMFLCLNNQDSYLIVINVIDYSVMSCNMAGISNVILKGMEGILWQSEKNGERENRKLVSRGWLWLKFGKKSGFGELSGCQADRKSGKIGGWFLWVFRKVLWRGGWIFAVEAALQDAEAVLLDAELKV